MRSRFVLMGVCMFSSVLRAEVRPPAVAGGFYPANAGELRAEVTKFTAVGAAGPAPVALIVPHAGYVYSGATAGKAFALLGATHPTRVILLGPSHHADFAGGALPATGVKAFATPLGEMPLDLDAVEKLRTGQEFAGPANAHGPEHCLEVELPFLQVTVGSVPIVPILVGHSTDPSRARAMAQRLAGLVGPGTVVVVSSDFTHHGPSYGYSPFPLDRALPARLAELARETAGRAAAIDPRGFAQQIEVSGDTVCGAAPITVLLELLKHAFAGAGSVADVTTSADVSHSFSQVVAYASVSFGGAWSSWRDGTRPPHLGELGETERAAALALARATLTTHLTRGGELAHWFASHDASGNLAADAGVFVTINNRDPGPRGRLRGCIGVIEAREPLVDAIVHAATSAAHDPRFPELSPRELDQVGLEISVLSPTHRVAGPDDIVLGKHGVLLGKAGRHAVFLPQVATETGWDLATFLGQLSLKAGLPANAWRSGASFEVFTAQVFGEPD
jgi:hypothetical protein